MEKAARIISAVFNPLLIPTYAMVIVLYRSILFIVSTGSKLGVIGMTFAFSCLLPLIAILLLIKLKVVSDAGLNERRERMIPYVIAAICDFGLAFYLHNIHSPAWLTMFMAGAGAATAISAVVSIWWKISAHAAGTAGFASLIFCLLYYQLNVFPMSGLLYASVIVCGIVCSSRLILGRHTPLQLLAGTVNGAICIFLAITLAFF